MIEMTQINIACVDPDGIKIYVSLPRMPHIQKNRQPEVSKGSVDQQLRAIRIVDEWFSRIVNQYCSKKKVRESGR